MGYEADTAHPAARAAPPAEGRDVERALTERLAAAAHALRRETVDREVTFLDTFDWRLAQGGRVCWAEARPQGSLLRLAEPGGGVLCLPVSAPPRFAAELADSPLASSLQAHAGERCLLSMVAVRERGERLSILDAEGKTRARVLVGESRARAVAPGLAGTAQGPLQGPGRRLARVEALRGYDRDAAEVEALVGGIAEQAGGSGAWDTAGEPGARLRLALGDIGRHPGDYSSRLVLELSPMQTAGEAMVAILRELLRTMRRNEQGAIEGWDAEFLHDFRVAMRRTRSAESELKGIHDFSWAEFEKEFRWLGSVTGAARDLDVHLQDLRSAAWAGDPVLAPAFASIEALVARQRAQAHGALAEALRSLRYHRLTMRWEAFLGSPRVAAGSEAGRPAQAFASERIRRAYRRVRRLGRGIDTASPDEDLHALRIRCKRLRYLLEFFRSLYPPEEIEPLVAAQKQLQDNLGRFNDLAVQGRALHGNALALAAAGPGQSVEALLAIGRFCERLARRQAKERGRCERTFAKFHHPRTRARFKALFRR